MLFRHLLHPGGVHGLKGDTLNEPGAAPWDWAYAAGNHPHRPLIEASRGANTLRDQVSVRVRSDGSEGVETARDQLSGGPRGHLDSVFCHRERNDRQVSGCAFLI